MYHRLFYVLTIVLTKMSRNVPWLESWVVMVVRVVADDVFLVILKVLAVFFDVSNFVISLDIVDGNTINQ